MDGGQAGSAVSLSCVRTEHVLVATAWFQVFLVRWRAWASSFYAVFHPLNWLFSLSRRLFQTTLAGTSEICPGVIAASCVTLGSEQKSGG